MNKIIASLFTSMPVAKIQEKMSKVGVTNEPGKQQIFSLVVEHLDRLIVKLFPYILLLVQGGEAFYRYAGSIF